MSSTEAFVIFESVDEKQVIDAIVKDSASITLDKGSVYAGTYKLQGNGGTYLALMMSSDLILEGYLEPVLIANRYFPDHLVMIFQETEMGSVVVGVKDGMVVYELDETTIRVTGKPEFLKEMPDFGSMDDIEERDESYGKELFVSRYNSDFGWVPGDYMRWINFSSELNWYIVYEDGKPVEHARAIAWHEFEEKAADQDLYNWPAELIGT